MNRQEYYPIDLSEQALWLANFARELPASCQQLNIAADRYLPICADARYVAYLVGSWIVGSRRFPLACTAFLQSMQMGSGPAVRPQWQEPPLPEGVVEVDAGALRRIFAFVQILKKTPGYTDSIGAILRILPRADAAEHPVPGFSLSIERGAGGEMVKVRFFKYGHMGVALASRRGGPDAPWEDLGIGIRSPWFDKRPLLVPGQPEVRQYRLRFWDDGAPTGEFTAVSQITVSP